MPVYGTSAAQNSSKSKDNDARRGADYAFHLYNAKAEQEDQDFMTDCNDAMDSLLVFAGLFSAVTTALIVESYKDLKADPSIRTQQLLEAMLNKMSDLSSPTDSLPSLPFSASASVVVTNTLFFLSLCVSLLAALGAILIKQWARNFYIGLHHITSPRRRARERYRRAKAIKEYKFTLIIAWIPMMLHVSLFLFLAGLVIWLGSLNTIVFITISIVCGSSLMIYILGAVIPSFDQNAPFEWPVASLLQMIPLHRLRLLTTPLLSAEEASLVTQESGKLKIFATPVDPFEALGHELSDPSPELVDVVLISEFLEHAETNVEVEAALDQLRLMLMSETCRVEEISPEIITKFIKKGEVLAVSCGMRDEELDIQSGTSSQRTVIVMQFFEVILQDTLMDMQSCEETLHSVVKVTRMFHQRAVMIGQKFLKTREWSDDDGERAVGSRALTNIALSASCLARLEALVGSEPEILTHVLNARKVMEILNQLGPIPAGIPQSRAWTTDEVQQYQALVCAYMTSFLELLIAFDTRGLNLKGEVVNKIKGIVRVLLDNSRDPIISKRTGNHHHLLQVLKNQWQAFHGEDNDRVAPMVVKHCLWTLGYDALFTDGVRAVQRPDRVNDASRFASLFS